MAGTACPHAGTVSQSLLGNGGSIAVLWEGLGLPVTLSTRGVDGGDRNTGGARAASYIFTMLESPRVRCAPLLN